MLSATIYVVAATRSTNEFYDAFLHVSNCDVGAENIHIALATARPYLWLACASRNWSEPRFPDAFLAAVKTDGLSLRFMHSKLHGPGMIAAAIEQNPLAIVYVTQLEPRMCLDCYRRNKNTFALFAYKAEQLYVARETLAGLISTLLSVGLSPNLLSEICTSLLLTDLFPRLFIDTPSQEELGADQLSVGWRFIRTRSRDITSWNMSLYDIWKLVRLVRESA